MLQVYNFRSQFSVVGDVLFTVCVFVCLCVFVCICVLFVCVCFVCVCVCSRVGVSVEQAVRAPRVCVRSRCPFLFRERGEVECTLTHCEGSGASARAVTPPDSTCALLDTRVEGRGGGGLAKSAPRCGHARQ